jgi:predicted Zn-dependent protease
MALHRYESAKEHLAFLRSGAGPKAQLDMAMGRYDDARPVLERMAESKRPEHLSRLAIFRWKTGDLDGADALLVEADAGYHGRFHRPEAWYHLHRGIFDLERGQYHDAMAHYLAAKDELAGYWLIDEHIAEIHLLQGNLEKARSMYEDLVERTGNPEFMDRLAETLEQQGEADAAKAMIARARAAYEERLKQFPEATWGHAIDHWIAWGDPAEALEMARKNHANRPNGDAKLALIQALMKAGELAEARKVMKEVQDSPFDVPEVAELAEALKQAK